jgi:hypothetical protein
VAIDTLEATVKERASLCQVDVCLQASIFLKYLSNVQQIRREREALAQIMSPTGDCQLMFIHQDREETIHQWLGIVSVGPVSFSTIKFPRARFITAHGHALEIDWHAR